MTAHSTETPERQASPYATVSKKDLILRDTLAADRTILANERTLLAYVRTGLAVLAAGITAIHFADARWLRLAGWIALPFGPGLLLWGTWRFLSVQRDLKRLR